MNNCFRILTLSLGLTVVAGCQVQPAKDDNSPEPVRLLLKKPPKTFGNEAEVGNRPFIEWVHKFRFDDLEQRLVDLCGRFTMHQKGLLYSSPFEYKKHREGNNWGAKASEAERKLEDLPKRLECWTKYADRMISRRADEYAEFNTYYNTLIGDGGLLKDRNQSGTVNWYVQPGPPNPRAFFGQRPIFERELEKLGEVLSDYPKYENKLRNEIATYRGWARKESASWNRAFNKAVANFQQTNPFNRPPSNNGVIQRTSDLFIGASPQVKMAMDNLDRAWFGEEAFNRMLVQQAAAYGAAAKSAKGGSGINLHLDSCRKEERTLKSGEVISKDICSNDKDPNAKRQSLDKLEAQYNANYDAAQKRRAEEYRRAAEMRARQEAAAARVASYPRCTGGCTESR